MGKKDSFDLDLQVSKNSGNVEPRVLSIAYCTPGTCWATCKGDATLHSNCCGSFVCSLGGGC
ncbi:gallidermin/nisin family lantibiotic [Bacillus cereus]|nr:gallidermin/nisin family lantibiotic [Bacillus cereus]MDA1766867.1 gallidermin/nisin family lantibiotic [Bacillus cereus]